MKKVLLFICFAALLWIASAIFLSFKQAQKIQVLDKYNNSCRKFEREKGLQVIGPNCVAQRRVGSIKTTIVFNDQGLPSSGVKEKNSKVLRICFLAGSNMVGLGIPEAYFPQKALNKEFEKALGRKVELINVSVEGYVAAQHALMFKIFFNHYNPDIVIAYTSTGYKVFKDAVQYSYTKKDGASFIKLLTLEDTLPAWAIAIIPDALRDSARTIIENIRVLKLERKLVNLANDKEKQARALLAPTVEFFEFMKNHTDKSGGKFYVVVDKKDFENVYTQRMYNVKSIDFIFNLFHPKLKVMNGKLTELLKERKIETVETNVSMSESDYFKDSIYFNESGIKKFAENLAGNFSRVYK